MCRADSNDYQIPTPIGGVLPVPRVYADIEQERRHRKLKFAASFRLLASFGLTEGIAGHVTVRDPEHHDRCWVNQYAQHFSTTHPDDLMCIDDAGAVHHGSGPVNTAAVAIHCGIHCVNHAALAVVHTHTAYGRAFAARGCSRRSIRKRVCSSRIMSCFAAISSCWRPTKVRASRKRWASARPRSFSTTAC